MDEILEYGMREPRLSTVRRSVSSHDRGVNLLPGPSGPSRRGSSIDLRRRSSVEGKYGAHLRLPSVRPASQSRRERGTSVSQTTSLSRFPREGVSRARSGTHSTHIGTRPEEPPSGRVLPGIPTSSGRRSSMDRTSGARVAPEDSFLSVESFRKVSLSASEAVLQII